MMIIGAGFGQLPAFECAKRLGVRIVCADARGDAPGMKLADASYIVDVKDKEKLLEIAQQEKVNGVLTMQSDLPVPSVGYINDHMGLCGASYDTAQVCSNKDLTRQVLLGKGLRQPKFEITETEAQCIEAVQSIGFPVVVKAADSSGSRGITKVDDEQSVSGAYEEATKYSLSGKVVVEQYIDGIEVGAQTFSVGGKCVLACIHDDQLSGGKFMIPVGHSYPLGRGRLDVETVHDEIKQCVEALGIEDGPANVDIIVDGEGRGYVIEVGARIGATCLPELTTHYIGQDWVEKTILNAIGEDVAFDTFEGKPCAALIITSPDDGVFEGAEIPQWVTDHPDLLEVEVTVEKGNSVSQLRKGTDRIGKVFVSGESSQEAETTAQQMIDVIKINVS